MSAINNMDSDDGLYKNYDRIWSNIFFPLDDLSYVPGVDPEFGKMTKREGNTFTTEYWYKNGTTPGKMPVSDDWNNAHNCYFGLTYDVNFTLDADYIGPMNYLFFGDDDLWLYLIKDGDYANAKLVCDIGGVHSAVGEYVDLWDYIEGGKDDHDTAEYTLRFFFMERGASGSTFYMSFVLPQVHPITPMDERGSLKVEKEVKDVTTDESFGFQIKLSGSDKLANEVYSAAVYKTANAEPEYKIFNGSDTLEVSLKHTGYVIIDNLPAGTAYTVTETANADYVTTKTGDTGTIEVNETAEAKFVNTYREGALTVSKTVEGAMAEDGKEFRFTVKLSDATINGQYGEMNFVDGEATFALKDGESVTATDLPADITYTVTEAAETLYDTTSTGATGTIEDDKTAAAAFTNTFNAGKLKVGKTVTGVNVDNDKAFEFTVTLSDTTINGQYGEMNFVDGVATFTLKNGEDIIAANLPAGITYTVVETADEDYVTTDTGATGTIVANKTVAAVVNNRTREGNLTVTKTVQGESADYQKAFEFTVKLSDTTINGQYGDMIFVDGEATFTLSHGQSASAVALPADVTYVVTETPDEDYNTSSTGAEGVIVDEESKIAEFLNVYREGDLTVTKTVTGEWADLEKAFQFTVTLTEAVNGTFGDMTFVDGVATFTLKNGETVTALNLPADVTYTVTEAEYNEYLTTSTGETGVIVDGETAEAVFNNHYNLGSLIVTKTVEGESADYQLPFQFTVTLSDTTINGVYGDVEFVNGVAVFTLSHGQSAEIVGLPDGVEYTVVETANEDYVTTYTGEIGVIEDSVIKTADFLNVYREGDLTVTKTVTGEWADYDKAFEFTVTLSEAVNGTFGDMTFVDGVATFTLKNGETATALNLPADVTYTVTEAEYNEYLTTSTGETGVIVDGETAEAAFNNHYNLGNLIVTKTVEGESADYEKGFEFTVTLSDTTINGVYGDVEFVNGVAVFTLAHGESATIAGLPNGVEYTVAETADEDYITTSTGETGVIEDSTTAETKFLNIYREGDLIVSKTVTGDWADYDKAFEFTVTLSEAVSGTFGDMTFVDGVATFTLKNGESATALDLPADVTYTVTEAVYDEYLTTSTGETGVIEHNKTAVAAFNNHYNLGNLIVSKTVTGEWGDKDKEFQFTIVLSEVISGTFGDVEFVSGIATFTLKDGESVNVTGLPADVTYTVIEDSYAEYLTTSTGATGIIEDSKTAEAVFTNHYNVGNLVITKTVEGESADYAKGFEFTVTLSDTTINGVYGDVEFVDGVAVFTLAHGESATIVGLPNGVEYTVVETADEDYITTYTGATGVIEDSVIKTADFLNVYREGDLTVTKTVTGEWADLEKEFTFTVTLSEAVNGTFGDMTFVDGVATFTLKNGETATALNLPADVTYTVTEAEYNEYLTTSTGETGIIVDGETAEAAFNNHYNLGNLIITKTVTGEWADLEKEFAFTVTLSDAAINGVYGDVEFVNGVAQFTLANGESVTIVGLPAGVEYTVAEEAYAEYLTTSVGEIGTIEASVIKQADFTNHYNVGDLEVYKLVIGQSGDVNKDFTFTVTLSDTTINGVYGDMTFVDGVATFTLKHDETAKAIGLPDGVTYTVTEAADEDYTTTFTGETGTITASTTARAEFTNDYREGELTVTKTVTGDEKDPEKPFLFTVTLSEPINGWFGGMFFTDGVATFTLIDGDVITATGLPADATYTVVESEYEDYFPSVNGVEGNEFSGVIDDDGKDTVDYVNHIASDAIVELEVLKTVDGLVPGDMLFDFILVDEEMNILQIAQNDADGVVTFDPLVFDAEGTYLYAIFENIVDDPAMDFDQSIYVVAVNVTLEENYEAEVIILKNEELYEGDMIFENKTVELTDLTVTKIWSGDGGNHQPDSILVQLYCNGEAFGEPVELNDANEWTYTWTDLRAEGNIWEVDEVEVPESYHKTVVYDQETDQWIITNEYVPETGDSTPVALLTAAMVLSLLGICAIVVLRRKRT